MAFGPPPDPIPATHQFLALLEFPELDAYDRNLLDWQKERMAQVRSQPAPAGWLQWYREALGAVRQLSAKWQAPKEADPQAQSAPSQPCNPAALARIKDANTAFIQRWNVRLQDQSLTVKSRLMEDVVRVPVGESRSETHIQFAVSEEELKRFANHATAVLNSWSQDVESKLTPSWQQHVTEAVAAERLVPPKVPSPPWPQARLGVSAGPLPHLEAHAVRRPTLFNAVMRIFRSVQSLISLIGTSIVGLVIAWFASDKGTTATTTQSLIRGAIATAGILLGAALGLFLGYRSLKDELAQAKIDQCQRIQTILQSWISTIVDGHRTRMQALVGSAGSEARSRLGEWADEAWGTRPAAPVVRVALRSNDFSSHLLTLNSVRNAMATRISQLELDIATAGAAAQAATPKA